MRRMVTALSLVIAMPFFALADGPVGERPYEMVWADRTEDDRPAVVDFEDLVGWTVETRDAEATWARSREQQLWGTYVAKLSYRATGEKPVVVLRPAKPLPLPSGFDCLNLWVYGNVWSYDVKPDTPQVDIALDLRATDGRAVRVPLGAVKWKEWWLLHQHLSPEQLATLAGGAALESITITGGLNRADRVLYFDNLSAYKEELRPLAFEPRPKRGIEPFAGQSHGTNTGPGKLPFPTREETLLPENLTTDFKTSLSTSDDGSYVFEYLGADGRMTYRYKPVTGTLSDVTAQWEGMPAFQPMVDGGVYLLTDSSSTAKPDRIEPVACSRQGDVVVSTWRCTFGKQTVEVTYTLRLWQKSLVVDVKCLGGAVGEFRIGRAVGLDDPRLVWVPYLTGMMRNRPALVVAGKAERPLFLFGLIDHYRSNGTALFAENAVNTKGVTYNGGSRYLPKTDGRRNDCFERLFLTVSPKFDEVLPTLPNPKSPWMHAAGERVWSTYYASHRDDDYAMWKQIARYGMSKLLVCDHEFCFRDGGESFTFRTKAAPKKGGDAGQADFAKKLHALGFRYGLYNNYTDYAPVNEHWSEDCVTRTSDGNWRTAWSRCYNPKPAWAVEMEARLAPQIQQKFQLNAAYCDVHTHVAPWWYCDFDARVPGAGTFAATIYAYGEILLHQQRTWNGPVYSEGGNHWYYAGLSDGNYGQDQHARLDTENPWLVDFDLRKIHPLQCNFGMGDPSMFYPGKHDWAGATYEQHQKALDRFIAATLAFGHTGYLPTQSASVESERSSTPIRPTHKIEGYRYLPLGSIAQSYFAVQQVHARYAEQTVADIRYADKHGRLLDTSAALASGAYKGSRVFVRYADGLELSVNGNTTEPWTIRLPDEAATLLGPIGKGGQLTLPPNGWFVFAPRGERLIALSALVDGHRVDYVDSPAYLYADGRGRKTTFPKATCDGPLIVLSNEDGTTEVIPLEACTTATVKLDSAAMGAEALDKERKSLGPIELTTTDAMTKIPTDGKAVSYLIPPAGGTPIERLERRGAKITLTQGQPTAVTATEGQLTDADMPLLAAMPTLKVVKLTGCPITDAGAKHLAGLKSLKVVGLDNTKVGDATLTIIAQLPGIVELLLSGTHVTDRGLEHLAGLAKLKKLRLRGTKVSGEGLAPLGKLPAIGDLDLSETRVDDAGLTHLVPLRSLVRLNLWSTAVTDKGVETLVEMPWLTWLNLDNTKVSDAGVARLERLENLKFLHLGRTSTSDASIDALGRLGKLEEIHVTRTRVSAAGAERLRSRLPRCKVRDQVEAAK